MVTKKISVEIPDNCVLDEKKLDELVKGAFVKKEKPTGLISSPKGTKMFLFFGSHWMPNPSEVIVSEVTFQGYDFLNKRDTWSEKGCESEYIQPMFRIKFKTADGHSIHVIAQSYWNTKVGKYSFNNPDEFLGSGARVKIDGDYLASGHIYFTTDKEKFRGILTEYKVGGWMDSTIEKAGAIKAFVESLR